MMSEAGSHDDGGSSMVFGNERHNRDNIFRDGSSNVPRALRGGRMPFRRPELQDGETTVAVFCRKHGLNPDYFRRKVRKHGLQALRQVTSEKVYHLADFEELCNSRQENLSL